MISVIPKVSNKIYSRVPKIIPEMPSEQCLRSMYIDECMSQRQIAHKLSVSGYRVYSGLVRKWLNYYNIKKEERLVIEVPMPPKEVIQQMYNNECMSQKQIGKEFNVNAWYVSKWMKYYGIKTRRKGSNKRDLRVSKNDLVKCIDNGLNQYQIAKKYKACTATIYNCCKRYGITNLVCNPRGNAQEYINWRHNVFYRDHNTCQMCGATNTYIEAHHILPFCDHPELVCDIDNGITLCKECHKSIRGREYDYIEQFAAITQPHYTMNDLCDCI